MDGVKLSKTPISTTTKLNKDENDKPVDENRFRGMIRSLLYLTASRPDIMFTTCLCAHFQSSPRESHLNAIKRIFKYLSGSLHLGLWYPRSSFFDLVSYSDKDFTGSLSDTKTSNFKIRLRQSRTINHAKIMFYEVQSLLI